MGRARWSPATDANGVRQRTTYDPTVVGGGKAVLEGTSDTSAPEHLVGPTAADAERDHYRNIGKDMAGRSAVNLDFSAADKDRANNLQAHTNEVGANTLLQGAAHGNAPSAAAINANQSAGNTLEAQLGASAGARGPSANAAQGAAASAVPNLNLQSANQAGYGRSGEINRALTGYGSSSQAMRAGDSALQQQDQKQAEAQAQQQLNQNVRNQQGQMGMEQLGINTEQAGVTGGNRLTDLQNKANQQTTEQGIENQNRGTKMYTSLSNMLPSDKRMKKHASLEKQGQSMRDQARANLDSLRYGDSVEKAKARSDGGDAGRKGPVEDFTDPSDVNEIRYGKHEAYDHSPYRSEEAGKTASLHRGIEEQLRHDDWRAQAIQQAREDQAEDAARPDHAGNARGYDLGTGYTEEAKVSKPRGAPAPGTEDWLKYGEPRKIERPVKNANEYIAGQAPTERVDAPMDEYSRAISTSDAGAKRQAYLLGRSHQSEQHQSGKPVEWAFGGRPHKGEDIIDTEAPRLSQEELYERAHKPGEGPAAEKLPDEPRVEFRPTDNSPLPPPPKRSADEGVFERAHRPGAAPPARVTHPPASAAANLRALWSVAHEPGEGPPAEPKTSDEDAKTPNKDDAEGGHDQRKLQQDANRKLKGSTYTYKKGFGEDPNQIHHGQMAQTMEENPITATAVRNDDPNGIKKVSEFDKLNVTASGVAELQQQHDELVAELEKMRSRRSRRTA